jgi:putative phosphonate metabolism protein
MATFPRYALYYAPEAETALGRFGSELLGYSAWTSEDVAFPAEVARGLPDWRDITADARKYGFHATLKAPFSLAGDQDEARLRAACATFAATPRTLPQVRPVVNAISGFVAVVPGDPSPQLKQLAADCVHAFEPFRAPMTPEDRARRKPERMTQRQVEYLDRWGYPYVMDEFRFHMTLTCRLGDDRRAAILAMLQKRFDALALDSLAIDRIALFKQDDSGARFRILESRALVSS